jgi:magnesium-transporting ATPase (P-type)
MNNEGATEWVLADCSHFLDSNGQPRPLTDQKRSELDTHILNMANMALRTLLLAHRDFPSPNDLPSDWESNPPDNANLCCDCIVGTLIVHIRVTQTYRLLYPTGIIDPLRSDVKEAVRIAQNAGVVVRMVTGDNIATACAIARQCGILTGLYSSPYPI